MSIEKQNRINAQQRRTLRRAALKVWALISRKEKRAAREWQKRLYLERCYGASEDLNP